MLHAVMAHIVRQENQAFPGKSSTHLFCHLAISTALHPEACYMGLFHEDRFFAHRAQGAKGIREGCAS